MPISLFIRPVYRRIRPVYQQNQSVGDFTIQILNQMDFGQFSPNFIEFGRFFLKTGGIGGSQFFSLRRFFKHCVEFADPRRQAEHDLVGVGWVGVGPCFACERFQ
jgi:hypothetical protein